MKKFVKSLIFCVGMLILVGCGDKKIEKPTITISDNNITLYVGETYEINAIVSDGSKYVINVDSDSLSVTGSNIEATKEGSGKISVVLESDNSVKAEISYTVILDEKPKFVFDNGVTQDVTITIGESFDCLSGVKAIDKEDGDITKNIVIKNSYDLNKVEAVSVVLEVTDSYGNVSSIVRIIDVLEEDKTSPVISLIDSSNEILKLEYEDSYDLKKDIKAIDDRDGDITNNVKINKMPDNKRYNVQEVELEVKDKAGNVCSFVRKIQYTWPYKTKFIGHAGSYFGVMNTEEAFLNCAKMLHYQYMECDLKQTIDGVFVTCHDEEFGSKTIATTKFADLKKVRVEKTRNSGYPSENYNGSPGYNVVPGTGVYRSGICTLERYLEICKEYGIIAVIELKGSSGITNDNQSKMPKLMELIESVGMLDQVIFLGSAYNCLIWVKQNGYDYIPCQYLVNSLDSQTVLDRCIKYGLDVSANVVSDYSNSVEWIKKYHDAGLEVSSWTYSQYVDYPVLQSWIDKGVDYVTSDWHDMSKLKLERIEEKEVDTKTEVVAYLEDKKVYLGL